MSKTEEQLREAFAGEFQANRTCLAFALAADKEGYPQATWGHRVCRHGSLREDSNQIQR